MRRSFRDNPLYAAVFNEYMHVMLTRGYSVEYFVEGGRSRTGPHAAAAARHAGDDGAQLFAQPSEAYCVCTSVRRL